MLASIQSLFKPLDILTWKNYINVFWLQVPYFSLCHLLIRAIREDKQTGVKQVTLLTYSLRAATVLPKKVPSSPFNSILQVIQSGL